MRLLYDGNEELANVLIQIIRADSDLLHITKASKGHRPSIEIKPSIAKCFVSVSVKYHKQQETNIRSG